MKLKELIKLEDKANEVWVISPGLHYDMEHKDFSEMVSVNLGEKTKYRYIVPATKQVAKNMSLYQKRYKLSAEEMTANFLILPESDLNPFLTECAIYNASTKCVACTAPAMENNTEVIQFTAETAKVMAKAFKKLWKKYKRVNP